jgi:hypothetical protein
MPAQLGAVLCALVIFIAIGTLIGAVFLRAACALYNKLVGGRRAPNSVPEPLLGKAMGITLVTSVVQAIAAFALGIIVGGAGVVGGADPRLVEVVAHLISLPLSLLVMAGMNAALLPTTFGRGILVALCYVVVLIFVAVVLGVLFGGLYLVATMLGG